MDSKKSETSILRQLWIKLFWVRTKQYLPKVSYNLTIFFQKVPVSLPRLELLWNLKFYLKLNKKVAYLGYFFQTAGILGLRGNFIK